jgi:hypothetical protein
LRNVFDQYDQQENKLTHALISALYNECNLVRPFLNWLKVKNIPPLKNIEISLQQLPGEDSQILTSDYDSVPDACFCDNENWAVLIESKVQAGISTNQLERHLKKAIRYCYNDIYVILITVDLPKQKLPTHVHHVQWKEIYQWFAIKSEKSNWARYFVEYMQIYESKMIAQNYNIRGTITMFKGFQFDKDNPYTYQEGKRLLRVLGREFRKNNHLKRKLGIDYKSEGRPKITKGDGGSVWDYIPLKNSKGKTFTSYPHATMAISPKEACVAITVPNGIKGGIKKRLKEGGVHNFYNVLEKIENNLRNIIKKAPDTTPFICVQQRFYKSQRSYPRTDGRIEVDLRTIINDKGTGLRHQPQWTEAIYNILTNKRTNLQLGIEVRFPFSAKCMQSSRAVDVMVDAWIAIKPILDLF